MTKQPSNALIIADSSALVSLAVHTDSNHARAVAISERLAADQRTILVPSDVFVETLNVLGKKSGHAVALKAAGVLQDTSAFAVIDTTERLSSALERFRTQPDSVSFTDCIVMAVADAYDTLDVFGFDAVFRTNGYRLPADPEPGRRAA